MNAPGKSIMTIGTLTVTLRLRESRSLKDKRQVLRSIQERLRNQFHVAISEIDEHDNPQVVGRAESSKPDILVGLTPCRASQSLSPTYKT